MRTSASEYGIQSRKPFACLVFYGDVICKTAFCHMAVMITVVLFHLKSLVVIDHYFYLDVIFHVLVLMLCVIHCQIVVLDKLCQSLIAARCAF